MKCPLKPKIKKYTNKQAYCAPIEHIEKDFAECDRGECMAYREGECKLIDVGGKP